MRRILSILFGLALVLALAIVPIQMALGVTTTTVCVTNLQPAWDAVGGGGVYSGYYGPEAYTAVSPGTTAVYDGREAAPIMAGINIDTVNDVDTPSGHYWDQCLYAFKPNMSIDALAVSAISWVVEAQSGACPVWMYIEIDKGGANDTVFQFVPTTNPAGWHTVNAAAGQWQKWNNWDGDTSGNPLISLSQVAGNYTGLNASRCYLNVGMGDAYHDNPSGTVDWVDKVTIGTVTYDFVVAGTKTATPTTGGTANFTTSNGNIVGLNGTPTPPKPPVALPYGMFNFTICCMNVSTATLSITLPGPVPTGYRWWKYVGGSWYSLPIGSNDGDSFITVTLRDNVLPDDEDTVPGQITDQGGVGSAPVGWETYPINKVRVFLPWIALFAAIAAGVSLLVIRRRRAQS
jgi:hypothetical protein